MISSKYEEAHVTVDVESKDKVISKYEYDGFTFISEIPTEQGEVKLSFVKVCVPKREDDYEDKMIRASRKSGVTKQDLMDTFTEKGLVGVYNLGLKSMLDYLNGN